MKQFVTLLIMAMCLSFVSCMKDYDEVDPITPDPDNGKPSLKASGGILSGDTIILPSNTYVKWYWENLPGASTDYTYNWNFGGVTSTLPSPEVKIPDGLYHVTCTATPIAGGTPTAADRWARIGNAPEETTIILISATPSGSNYIYRVGMNTAKVNNWNTITTDPWFTGDYTAWSQTPTTTTQTINGMVYLYKDLTFPATMTNFQEFSYGRGNEWSYDPNSAYWRTSTTGGVYRAYFTNGTMSPSPITVSILPGDGGDVQVGDTLATSRDQLIYGVNDSIRIYVNHGAYANGPQPFISVIGANQQWQNFPLIIDPQYPGWSYKTFRISEIPSGLLKWRFGPNLNSPTIYGTMLNSKFYDSSQNLLALQVSSIDGVPAKKYIVQKIARVNNEEM